MQKDAFLYWYQLRSSVKIGVSSYFYEDNIHNYSYYMIVSLCDFLSFEAFNCPNKVTAKLAISTALVSSPFKQRSFIFQITNMTIFSSTANVSVVQINLQLSSFDYKIHRSYYLSMQYIIVNLQLTHGAWIFPKIFHYTHKYSSNWHQSFHFHRTTRECVNTAHSSYTNTHPKIQKS